jgi:hypothetical protein
MAQQNSLRDGGNLRKYYVAIPNLVLTLGLRPFELALYIHIKQAAGDDGGVCWKSRNTMARESGMSSGMVTKARRSLELPRAELGGKSLITVAKESKSSTLRASITNIWELNMSKYSSLLRPDVASPDDLATASDDQSRHQTTFQTSQHVPKEEPLNKNQEEARYDFIFRLKSDPAYSHVDIEHELELMQRWLARPGNEALRLTERFVLKWINRIDRSVEVGKLGLTETHQDRNDRELALKKKMGWDRLDGRTA